MRQEDNRYEQRSLKTGMWANLGMGVAGVTAAHLSNSDALMIDGLYSGVNFASAIVAGKVAASVGRQPDRRRPFGYEADESLYVLARSLVLLGILAFAAFNSLNKIVRYAGGAEMPELIFGPITIYMFAMVTTCFGLAAWHDLNWKKGGRVSDILKAERSASIVDGLISAGAGGALLGVTLLEGTQFAFIIPVADAIVVLILATVMLGQPAGMLRNALREVVGESVAPELAGQIRARIDGVIEHLPCDLLEVAVTKLGRMHSVVSYIKPHGSVTADDLDTLRGELHASYSDILDLARSEIVFTAKSPYA